eukprot:CAMPEP_0182594044 /NCGR_PEP_ID=MMETSP1324-20130603/79328_1 /TAXON_ID=236786 /ORGANISM="Florenciella sp., Strain RCC1587" /LENGTH=45 /DNA_ID= /DNA_START= /DNA_END= /DNA_ORIENTATION=
MRAATVSSEALLRASVMPELNSSPVLSPCNILGNMSSAATIIRLS